MHEFFDQLSDQELAQALFDTERGLHALCEDLHKTDIGDYYDKFIEETCEVLCWLFVHKKPSGDN